MRAVQQAQKQANITQQESEVLVRSLLRVSIFHVSFLRGLFSEEHYRAMPLQNLDGMTIRMLTPACAESKRLIDWVESGVHDALEKRYIKTLFFGISADASGRSLLEEYIFNFDFSDGTARLDLTTDGKKFSSGKAVAGQGVNEVKFQVIRLMRMLVQICQTLESVPEERFLFMKMSYHAGTPDDYEPPGFKALDEEEAGYFARRPFAMDIGSVETQYHGVRLRVKSMLDACGLGSESDKEAEMKSMQNSTVAGSAMQGDSGAEAANDSPGMDEDTACQASVAATVLNGKVDSPVDLAATIAAVTAFCRERKSVEVADVLTHFVDVTAAVVDERILPALLADGTLARTQLADRYAVVGKGNDSSHGDAVAAAAEGLQNLNVKPAGPDRRAERGGNHFTRSKTCQAEIHTSHAGSAATRSEANPAAMSAKQHEPGHKAPAESGPPKPVFFESQQSHMEAAGVSAKRSRKASCVELPIHQVAKRTRASRA